MLVSHTNKLIFVHIQKTGGSTISELLTQNLDDTGSLGAKHGFLKDSLSAFPEWKEYYKFAFVRNPWDRLVSWYSMISNAKNIPAEDILKDSRQEKHYRQAKTNKLWKYVYENASSFEEFVKYCTEPIEVETNTQYSFIFNQLDYISDHEGNLIVDDIGRFEDFKFDLLKIFGKINLKVDTPSAQNISKHRHYSHYYNPETRKIVAERFSRDIEYFGYEFDDR